MDDTELTEAPKDVGVIVTHGVCVNDGATSAIIKCGKSGRVEANSKVKPGPNHPKNLHEPSDVGDHTHRTCTGHKNVHTGDTKYLDGSVAKVRLLSSLPISVIFHGIGNVHPVSDGAIFSDGNKMSLVTRSITKHIDNSVPPPD